ncbi:MAG: TRAP transporter substrate-binding protein DctP [Treponema sp.]|nr:TRAP transporter substrate-binding protein DctP [Treponema sp.]
MKNIRYLLVILLLLFSANTLFAQRRIPPIRLASLVPENTPWGQAINKMAAELSRVTNDEVQLIIFHNATAGDEPEVLRKLRMNELQAAVFTSVGLSSVMPEVMAVSYPFLIRNDAELNEVMSKIRPELDVKIQQNGFVTLAWAQAGWVKFFSKAPIYVPADLRKMKLGIGSEEEMLQAFRIMGYQMVSTSLSQVLSDLNSGRIDVVYQSPVYAGASQLFGVAKNMTDLNIAPFMGGILMNETAWRRIPDRHKNSILAVCKQIEKEIETSIMNLERDTINTMVRHGLQIVKPTAAQAQEWYDDTNKFETRLIGGNSPVFNREYYQKISAILDQYRKRQ